MHHDAERYDSKARHLSSHQTKVAEKLGEIIHDYETFDQRWAGTKLERRLLAHLVDCPDSVTICEWGCYTGKLSIYLSKKYPRVEVHGLDISQDSLKLASQLSAELSASSSFICADLGSTNFCLRPDSVDAIVGFGILHHIPSATAYQNIATALKSGGRAFFLEPTSLNPFVALYRRLRNEAYSPNEIPVNLETITEIREALPNCVVDFSTEHLLSTWLTSLMKVATNAPFGISRPFFRNQLDRKLISACGRLDDLLLRKFPFLRRYVQYFIITIDKL